MALGLMMLLMTLVMEVTVAFQQQRIDANQIVLLARAPASFFVQMSLLAALAVCFSTFVSPLVNFFLSGGMYLVGTLFSTFFQTLKENPSTKPVAKLVAEFVNVVLPNFSYYNVQNPIINPEQHIQNPTVYFISTSLYGLFYIGIFLLIGILVFDRREV